MFCAMFSLDVLFFACHRLESMTLQPSKVDGLVDATCGLPCGIYALLQYLPVFLNQFSAGLLRLLRGPDM